MNTSNTEGVFDKAKGKVEQAVGETFGDQTLANKGAANQVKGNAEETWGNVKDTASNIGSTTKTDAENTGHGVRDGIANAASDVKNSISRGLDHLEGKD